jgi:YVTN family beta-propeller protein
LKDIGKTVAFQAVPPFAVLKVLDTGPITNHVNFVHTARGQFAYVTVGGLNQVQVFDTSDFSKVATIPVGKLPHGIWPSGDGSRIYVGLENADELAVIDTATNSVLATVPIGQAPQALTYVSNAVPDGPGTSGLQPLGVAGQAVHLTLDSRSDKAVTSVSLFDQGLVQVLQAAVNGLEPKSPYVLSLATRPDGAGAIEPLSAFVTNPAGSAIVNAIGPIRQLVRPDSPDQRRYLVVMTGTPQALGTVVQFQSP